VNGVGFGDRIGQKLTGQLFNIAAGQLSLEKIEIVAGDFLEVGEAKLAGGLAEIAAGTPGGPAVF
jgi:hypothetical protein